MLALRISVFYLHHVAFDCISRGFQFSISFCSAGTTGWWLMVTYQNLDLRNVIVHGNSSEQDLVQTHCLGRRLTLQVQSLQTSRQSKSGDVANCCQLLQTAREDHHKTYYVCACGHVHQCLHAHLLFLWHRQWWNSARCSTQILFSRFWNTTLTDAGTNLVQSHSPGLGCSNFHIARGILNFPLQKERKTWRLLALRISLFHLHHIAFGFPIFRFLFRMVVYQNLDLRNVIVHGNSSEQDRASPEMLPTVANCKWRPSQNPLSLQLWLQKESTTSRFFWIQNLTISLAPYRILMHFSAFPHLCSARRTGWW